MQSSSSSSLDRPKMNYDVFISFRGRDVRHTFAGYLYDALNRLGIKAFLDNKRFLIGDDLHDLFKIIDESRSAIVVLSEDYASAKWCLRELTKIMDSMGTSMERVLPVFYHIDPSIVKDQSGTFKTSFDEHEANALKEIDNQEKEKRLKELQNWKNALKKIGNHTGVVITKNSSEVDIVNKIASQIFDAWRPKLEALNKNLVGMTSRLLHMNMHLGLGLDDVRFVAIVGMGGIGKTTIAQVVFDCILSKFDDCCFLTLPGGDSKQSLVSLQREMLSQIFHKEDFRIWHENHGVEMIKNRLSGRKVLIVLDGVEERRQLEMLAGSTDWFGPGSRIIITTRNKGLLCHPNYDEMKEYNVEELDHDSALQLFLKHAFGSNHQNKDSFMDLSNEIVEKAKRLPLALRVIGSSLYGKEITIWRETLKRLIKVDERNFFDILKISYDGLGVESQQVFLDITCFFNGKNEDRVNEILESFGYSPNSELQLLMQRCLIEVSHKKILVHDLILEMGREIVRKESLTQPEKQSRIWLHEDLYCRFAEKHDLMHIQGIVLSLEKEMEESIELDAESFSEMTKLRILEINNVELDEDIEYLSPLLRIINWLGYPSKSLPPTFQSRYLFELLLPHSHLLRVWDGKKRFPKLKLIDVSNSEHLRVTPDFSGVPNLERLVLCNCVRLCEIHPSINSLNKLILLDLEGCGDLKHFPANIRCKNLQTLKLSGTGLEIFPEIGHMEHLTHLHLDGSKITHLHPSIGYLTGLVFLDLSTCLGLSSLPFEIGNLKSLKTLLLKYCKRLDKIPPSLANAESLETLSISETSITHVPSSIIHCLKNLETLDCEGLSRGIWKSLLPQLNINQTITTGLGCLKALNLMGCKLMDEDIPEDLHCFSSLEALDLSYNNFTTLPDSLSHLKKLKTLNLNYCTELKDLPKLPESLQYVGGVDCRSMSEQYYNKILLIPSSSGHQLYLTFIIPSKDADVECAMNEFQHSIFTRRSFEQSIIEEQPSTIVHDTVDMFQWFGQINEGNWTNIQYEQEFSISKPLNIMYEDVDLSNVCGVFLSTNIEFPQNLNHLAIGRFLVSFGIDGKCSGGTMNYEMSQFKAARFFWVAYIPIWMIKDHSLMVQRCCSVKVTISYCCDHIDASKVKIKACGVSSMLSWPNVAEYLAKLFTERFCSKRNFYTMIRQHNDHQTECRCDELEVGKDDFSSSTFESNDSTFLLRKNLRAILGVMFEEKKRYYMKYFFPHTKIFGWFKNQNKKDKVAVKIPVNIEKDRKWMGLAMFVVFSISEKASCYCFEYEIQTKENIISTQRHFISTDQVLEHSNQILFVAFEPRYNWYPYDELKSSSSNHVYINFNTNGARMRVEFCGARLVYQQNVEGLIHTILNCIAESGDELYEHYNQYIVESHLTFINTHWYTLSFRRNNSVKNQPSTAASTCTASSLSVEHLLYGSFPHPFFHKSLQERFRSKFDLLLHGDKIPKFFSNQSGGNMTEIKLPQYLEKFRESVGLAVCALVVVDKKRRKLNEIMPERERYTKVVDLICKFKVDSYQIMPEHCHFTSQQKLLSEYASQFLWLSYIPLHGFNINWHYCTQFEVALETSCDELFGVKNCGLHLIHKHERMMIDRMIMESTVPSSTSHKGKEPQIQ
ncbi:TMV resistance protein N-like [Cucumis melo var. makuwa]|uniref:ADP-ribosyl cyclase/cyclic ADP-ribose hydrolase n=1 Tax=Cucumis melo var. makuwa TaxID=1194695 RepID=A0A5A7T7V5_CUCMM|nr:TMV resistance protein N-like [Cucumis melo var. makuwa]TYK00512.1 TMV resistance protein N-like [Cucumis melo var. makuwa]